ncbi:RibD family protein [Arenibaculum pallidiluteum]|uniref:RibD family protein n=1 Tax=Arenibaculum pallidiluteum TaxID=2812559 RepID=UPI001A95A15A|nr:RibD family protein [Arenibaculum pallidiluteum]
MRSINVDDPLWEALLGVGLPAGRAERAQAEPAWELYAPLARRDRPLVLAQLGQSLDGRIATVTGHSRTISCDEALVHLHRCRALVDAVVVGVGTVLADDPMLNVRHVPGPDPARVVIDPRGRVPDGAKVFRDDGCRRIVIQTARVPRPPGVEVVEIAADGDNGLPPRAIVAALAELGLRRLLVEGGAKTIARFIAAGAVDRLHVGIAPLIIGAGPVGLCLPPIERLDSAIRPQAQVYALGRDVLFDCMLGSSGRLAEGPGGSAGLSGP